MNYNTTSFRLTNLMNKKILTIVITLFLLLISYSPFGVSADSNIEYTFHFNEPNLKNKELFNEVFTEYNIRNTISIGNEIGKPVIQVESFQILIPYGKGIDKITINTPQILEVDADLKGFDLIQNPITPFQGSIPIGEKITDSLIIDEETYLSSNAYPEETYESLGINYCKGYPILSINLYPTKYVPGEGRLYYFPEIIVTIDLKDSSYINPFFRNNINDKNWVQSLVLNPIVADSYDNKILDNSRYDNGLCDPSDNNGNGYDYVIITRESLADFSDQIYNWTDLINKKQLDGLEATLVTVEEITSCIDYWNSTSLFNDTPAKIREFCKDAYNDWGTEYILIAGDHSGAAEIPRRLMETAYESNIETDIYWSNLDKTFNDNSDSYWGEAGDTGFDLYSEIFIGSIPCDEPEDISNWLTKSFYYADSQEQDYLDNAAFYGGDTGWNCQGDDFEDFTIYGTDYWLGPDPDVDGPWPGFIGFLYGFDTWNSSNPGIEYNTSVRWTAEPPNPGWQGGSESGAIAGLRDAINNDQATLISGIAHANSVMALDVLAFAAVFNTGYGWGNLDSTNSSSALQQKLFWDYMFNLSKSGGTMNWQLGKAQAYSKDIMAPTINWDPSYGTWRSIIQGCLLFGDPAQNIKPPVMPEHNVGVMNINVQSHVIPDELIYVNTTIVNNGENNESNVFISFRIDGIEIENTTITLLESISTQQVSFTWTPTLGSYEVTINVSIPDVTEDFYHDNEKTKIVIAGPDIAVTNIQVPDYAGINYQTNITGTISNLGATNELVDVYLKIDGSIEDNITILLNESNDTDITFLWYPAVAGTYPVGIYVNTTGLEPYLLNNELNKDVTVFYSKGNILLVDDDEGDPYETYYENAILASGYLYTIWDTDVDGSPSDSIMSSYDVIVWFTGDDISSTLISTDQTNLANYLDAGGKLFVTGQDIGYDIRTEAFYSDYLYATYNVDDTNIFRLDGIIDDPIGDGLQIEISSGDGANNQGYPEGITPISPATEVFIYNDSSYYGGLKVDTGVYQVVYFGFGFEAINNMDDRQTVMTRILSWLIGEIAPEIVNVSSDTIIQDPDGYVNITCDINNPSRAVINTVLVNITDPDSIETSHPMTQIGSSNVYYYNSNYSMNGTYCYYVMGEIDTGNDIISESHYYHIGDAFPMFLDSVDAGWNMITVPMNNSYTASSLAAEIVGCSIVSRFDAEIQTYQSFIVGVSPPSADFDIMDGVSYFVVVGEDSIYFASGDPIVSVSVPLNASGSGWNMIGWYHDYDTTASSLGENISDCSIVSMFDASLQTYSSFIVGVSPPSADFTISCGMGVFVVVDDESTWAG